MLDEDYKRAGFRLLPTTKPDRISAFMILLSAISLIPVALLPTWYGFAGYTLAVLSTVAGLLFVYFALQLFLKRDLASARKVMFTSFFILPLMQLVLLLDFIRI